MLGKAGSKLRSNSAEEVIALSVNANHTFFGYYDKTPFSTDDRTVLGMVCLKNSKHEVAVGYFDLTDNNAFTSVGVSETWSWQLGARLQWHPVNGNDTICYNKMVDKGYGSVFQNIKTKKIERHYNYPIYDIRHDGRYALSLNFARLHRLRPGYGYGNLIDTTAGSNCPRDDGIYLIDLDTGDRDLIISLESIVKVRTQTSMAGAEHYFNHLSFSPDGARFMFLHLWVVKGKRFSRLITSDMHGSGLYVIEDGVNMSHYAWKSAKELLAHTSSKPFGTKFYLYEDTTPNRSIVGKNQLVEPGHPSYSPDGNLLIVDTYPNKYGNQKLTLYTANGDLIENIGNFYSPSEFSGAEKCDLHPRWSRHGDYICVDSAMSGHRAMYLIKSRYSKV